MLDRLVGLLDINVGGKVDNGKVDDVGSFDSRAVCSFPANKFRNIGGT